jgi:putative redox protein
MKTVTHWTGGENFDNVFLDHHIKTSGNRAEGYSPKALLLSGLAGCSAVDVVDILTKMKVPFTKFSASAEAELTEEHPKVFTIIRLLYTIDVAPESKDKVQRAVDLSLNKYCGVAAMLRKNCPIEFTIELI